MLGSLFQLTAARRRLVAQSGAQQPPIQVSTHSRPKAAGRLFPSETKLNKQFQLTAARRRLGQHAAPRQQHHRFNSQPPEGGWVWDLFGKSYVCVSTHSRPKAAGHAEENGAGQAGGFNSQPPEGGWQAKQTPRRQSAPFQLTAARRRLGAVFFHLVGQCLFQLTAARRRLAGWLFGC